MSASSRPRIRSRVCRLASLAAALALLSGALGPATPALAQREFVAQLTGFLNGQLRFPKIVLWSKPGGAPAGAHKVAEVRSGTMVKVISHRRSKGMQWALVSSFGVETHPNGWVPEVLIRVQ